MPQDALQDVFTADELARAAGVPLASIEDLVTRGDLRRVGRTVFFAGRDAVAAGRQLRARPPSLPAALPAALFSARLDSATSTSRRSRLPVIASSCVHGAILAALLVFTSGSTQTAPAPATEDQPRLVFLVTPGPGGGGGGGGGGDPLPAPKVERRGRQRARVTVPEVKPEAMLAARRTPEPPRRSPAPQPRPVVPDPEPLPSQVLVAPVADAAAEERDRTGVIEHPQGTAASQGAGAGGGAGQGQGAGNGEGLGSGIGDGAGGGTGGGPFRPGSGIEPPRLLREVKAQYTDEARRRNLTGDVLLEIVVTRNGTVGDVTVLQGLGGGLDERAVAAVRQWQFAPARRRGEAVDVLVEVAVEFTLR